VEQVAEIALGAALLLTLALTCLYVSRQRALSRRVGSFGCHLREGIGAQRALSPTGTPAGGAAPPVDRWHIGRGQYCAGRLVWWRTLSLSPRPARTWVRDRLVVVGRTASGEEDDSGTPLLVVTCTHEGEAFELRMTPSAYAGLVSWLESAPRAAGRGL
jgi:hypothetical protein